MRGLDEPPVIYHMCWHNTRESWPWGCQVLGASPEQANVCSTTYLIAHLASSSDLLSLCSA